MEPVEPKGWMDNIAEGPEVCEAGRATTAQGGTRGPRKPGAAVATAVPGGAEAARSHGATNRSKNRTVSAGGTMLVDPPPSCRW